MSGLLFCGSSVSGSGKQQQHNLITLKSGISLCPIMIFHDPPNMNLH